MIERIDHLGVLVDDIGVQRSVYGELGLSVGGVETVPEFGVDVAFLPVGESLIELVEPHDEDGDIGAPLAETNDGALLHHVAFRVDDIDASLDSLDAAGVPLLDDEPRPGAGGARVAFLADRAAGGVSIELVERETDLTFD